MAITRAQQAKQMLQKGGRANPFDVGFNVAEAAANVGKASTKSDFDASADRVAAATDVTSMQQAFGTKDNITADQQINRQRLRDQREGTQETLREIRKEQNPIKKLLEGYTTNTRKTLYNIFPNNPKNELDFLRQLPASQRALLSPALRAKLEALELDEDQDLLDTANTKFTFDEFEELRKFQPTEGLNFAEYAAKFKGAPGLLYSGDVGNLIKTRNKDGTFSYRRDFSQDDKPMQMANKIITDPTDPADPNQTTDVFAGIAPRFSGSIFDFDKLRRQLAEESAADGGRIGADKGGIMMASAPDPMDTRNDMMQNLAIDTFGKPLKDLTEDEIIQIEEMMMEMDQYSSKPTSRSNKIMADLDIETMFDNAKEQMSQTRFGKSYDELEPLEKELILEILRGIGKDVFGEKQMLESDRVMAQEGGIMDLETGRQMYFLGKLVKKATRAVKKIAKSPLGKVAIGAAALKFGPAIFGKGSFNPFLMSPDKGASFDFSGLGKILNKAGLVNTEGGLTLGGKFGLGTLALPFLMGDQKKEEDLNMGPELTMEQLLAIRGNPYGTTAPRFEGSKFAFAADGGRIGYQEGSKEPVAKKTMPLLDMGGKEMDLRDNGGFVPIGRMEKADDVPARLSKNEFVFTADAVRNAGEGDVDKGAEVMYNMMKNLESGGQVSEESQGLEGARKMFQTSKRLEEVL